MTTFRFHFTSKTEATIVSDTFSSNCWIIHYIYANGNNMYSKWQCNAANAANEMKTANNNSSMIITNNIITTNDFVKRNSQFYYNTVLQYSKYLL